MQDPLPVDSKSWHVELLQFALTVCGCNVPPSHATPIVSAKAKPKISIYYDVELALVQKQRMMRRMRVMSRDYLIAVSAAFSALAISEDSVRNASVRRILPGWYKTRPQQHQHATTRASDEQRLTMIDAVVVP